MIYKVEASVDRDVKQGMIDEANQTPLIADRQAGGGGV